MPNLDFETVILTESVRLLELWGDKLRSGNPSNGGYLWLAVTYDKPRYDTTAYQVRHFGTPYEPKFWLNRTPTAAERQGFSRCVKRLASEGLLELVARWGIRTSHLRLTPKGLQTAIERMDPADLDLEAVHLALENCKWATEQIRAESEAGR